ncbi:hypothetical protein ACFQGT_17790 [Natrialbaceae archaeon GCM10025810]|uniref:hypothetical protein n=1 Tax=Halovalidus salilacus TaxID=3075124 RepID=UPI003607983D
MTVHIDTIETEWGPRVRVHTTLAARVHQISLFSENSDGALEFVGAVDLDEGEAAPGTTIHAIVALEEAGYDIDASVPII